jgi:hypothetical protein
MRIAAKLATLDLAALRKDVRRSPLLSANAKTTVSFDLPIGHTCDPTQLCAAVCFGSRPGAPTTWDKSLRKRLRNLRYLQVADTEEVVERLTSEFRRRQRLWATKGVVLDFVRFNGIGDLVAAMVAVINEFAARNHDIRVWIVTRRFDLAAQIKPLPNIYLQLSLDASTPPGLIESVRRLVAEHPRAYCSFLRSEPDDHTFVAAIVFNEKRTEGLPFHSKTDCPVDAGRLPLGNVRGVGGDACSKCRKCFTEGVLERQRRMLDFAAVPDRKRHLLVLGDGALSSRVGQSAKERST